MEYLKQLERELSSFKRYSICGEGYVVTEIKVESYARGEDLFSPRVEKASVTLKNIYKGHLTVSGTANDLSLALYKLMKEETK